jgi:hypothetical protein
MRGLFARRAGSFCCRPTAFAPVRQMRTGDPALGPADTWSRLTGRGQIDRGTGRRRCCGSRDRPLPPWGLLAMARRHRPCRPTSMSDTSTFPLVFWKPMRQSGAEVVVLIHDLIPITHPDLVPPKQPARFARRIARCRDHASLVVAVSQDTETALSAHWAPPPTPRPSSAPRSGCRRFPTRPRSRQRPVPDGRNAGAPEKPRRDPGRLGPSGRRASARSDATAGHPGSAGLARGGDRGKHPNASAVRQDDFSRHRRVR